MNVEIGKYKIFECLGRARDLTSRHWNKIHAIYPASIADLNVRFTKIRNNSPQTSNDIHFNVVQSNRELYGFIILKGCAK